MKTLDEVIKALEICIGYYCSNAEHDVCPYLGESDMGCMKEPEKDALYYLKMYRSDMQMYAANQKLWEDELQQKIKDFGDAKERYIARLKELDIGTLNEPLTWDELTAMQGKPVWIDSVPAVRRWVIIKKFHPIGGNKNLYDMEVEDGGHFLRKNMRRDDPAWWQAYRKERK